MRGLDSNGDTEDLQFPAELNENSYMYHREPKSQRERTLEARPDTGVWCTLYCILKKLF